MKVKAKIYVIEGADGTGKTTLAKNLVERMKDDGVVYYIREPGGSPEAEKVREELLSNDELTELERVALFAKARRLMFEYWEEKFNEECTVIMDRSFVSSIVYQGILGGANPFNVWYENEEVIQKYPIKKLFILNGEAEVLKERAMSADVEVNHFDEAPLEHYKKLTVTYSLVGDFVKKCSEDNIEVVHIDTTELTKEEVLEKVYKQIGKGSAL